jgi:hypothetical protein
VNPAFATWRPVLALRSVRVAMALATACGVALAIVPLLGVLGVESALLLGVVLPPFAALCGARVALAARSAPVASGAVLLQRALASGALILLGPVLVLLLNALRVRTCAPLEGLTFLALGPLSGIVLASLIGAVAGSLPLRPWLATALAVLVPVADIARAIGDFLGTPAVFAYGHFFGYFPGSLYDELVGVPWPLLTLRIFSLCALSALCALLVAHHDPGASRLRAWPLPGRRSALIVSVPCALLFAAGWLNAVPLGHRASSQHIAQVLGGRALSQRCELIVPRELRRARRERLADDCDFRVRQMERWLGVRHPHRLRVLLFRNADEKRGLMGAASTNIAKPWRSEVYLQDDVWPHPVLAHEIAHVVASNVGRGPLRVAGRLGGLVPDFALIEGLAVAAAWANSSGAGLTPHQWTRALLEEGFLPPLKELFGTGFLAQQKRLAYTVSGSLLRWIAEQHGSAAVRRIYQTHDVAGALGTTLPELERRFRAYLLTVELPDSARALARQRFAGSSILSGVCPHEKARLRQQLDGELIANDTAEAQRTCEQLLAIDDKDANVHALLATVHARRRDLPAAKRELDRLQRELGAPPPVLASVRHAIADEAWRNGREAEALAAYRQLLAEPNDRDAVRVLQVKRLALEGSARERALIFALLVGEPGQAVDGAVAVYLARELRALRADGLPHYLEARQLAGRERFAEAAQLFATARALGLPSPELTLEGLRLEALARAGAADLGAARALYARLLTSQDAPRAVRDEASEWLSRIAWLQTRKR